MGKKFVLGFALIVFSVIMLVSNAFAEGTLNMYMVTGNGSATPQTTPYSYSSQPWLYINFPAATSHFVSSFWYYDIVKFAFEQDISNLQNIWLSPSNWFTTTRAAGTWEVSGAATGSFGNLHNNLKFDVAPEPISSALFLLGGGALLAGKRLRKRK